jgi:Transposase DDE domain group 1
VDRKIGLLRRVVRCFTDARDPQRIAHELSEMLAQRIYGLALGYEDLNDHEELRNDPLLGMLAGRRDLDAPLAGKSTLNRLERTPTGSPSAERHSKISYSPEALDELLVTIFLEAHPQAPQEIVLDLDATDTPLHGRQEARFFHGYYGHYCYLPLYVFCGDHLLCARLRPSNLDASAGSREEVQRLVRQIRARWPKVSIILRADSGFCREELLAWCENNDVDYVFGFARNKRLRKIIGRAMQQAKQEHRRTGKPARVFCEFAYRTKKSWSRARRVIAKAEQLEGKENPRYLVTSLSKEAWPAQQLYEQLYCARRDGEPHQGAIEPVRGSPEHGDPAGQSVAAVLFLAGVRAARGAAAVGLGGHGMGGSPSRHHPAEAAENRCRGAHHRAPHLGSLQLRLSLAECFRCGLDGAALLKTSASSQNSLLVPLAPVKCAQKTAPSPPGHPRSAEKNKIGPLPPAPRAENQPLSPTS